MHCNNGIDDKLEVNEGMYIEMPHHVDKVFNLANKWVLGVLHFSYSME